VNTNHNGTIPTNPYTPTTISYKNEDYTTRVGGEITGGYEIKYQDSCNEETAASGQKFKVKIDYTDPKNPVESIIGVVSTVGNKSGTDATTVTGTNQNPGSSEHKPYGTDCNDNNIVSGYGFNDSIEISGGLTASNRERGAAIRYGNVS